MHTHQVVAPFTGIATPFFLSLIISMSITATCSYEKCAQAQYAKHRSALCGKEVEQGRADLERDSRSAWYRACGGAGVRPRPLHVVANKTFTFPSGRCVRKNRIQVGGRNRHRSTWGWRGALRSGPAVHRGIITSDSRPSALPESYLCRTYIPR